MVGRVCVCVAKGEKRKIANVDIIYALQFFPDRTGGRENNSEEWYGVVISKC